MVNAFAIVIGCVRTAVGSLEGLKKSSRTGAFLFF